MSPTEDPPKEVDNQNKNHTKGNIFEEIPQHGYKEPPPSIQPDEFIKVIESRRSVRVFTDEKIPAEIIEKCLDLTLQAPNSSNLQPWEFYWVRNPQKKAALVKACFSQPAARTAAEIIICVARTQTWKKHCQQMLDFFESHPEEVPSSVTAYYKKLSPMIYTQGPFGIFGLLKKVAFSLIGIFQPVPREPTSRSEMRTWAVKSTALACENLMLALRAFGYDSCPMEGLDSRRVKKLLSLPSDAIITMGVAAGRRAENGIYSPRIRFPREQFIKIID